MTDAQSHEPVPPSLLPDQLPMIRALDPASLLGFRTPLQEHPAAADGKSAALLTVLGILFTILGRYAKLLGRIVSHGGIGRWAVLALLLAFGVLAMGTVVQAFRTLSPRFPKAPPSLAFFGDIARLSRDEYISRVESLGPEEAVRQILDYNYTVSAICIEKFKQLRLGIRLFKAAFPLWMALMAIVLARMAIA